MGVSMNCSIVIRAYNESIHLPRLLEDQHQTIKDVKSFWLIPAPRMRLFHRRILWSTNCAHPSDDLPSDGRSFWRPRARMSSLSLPAHTSIRLSGLAGNPPARLMTNGALTYGKQRGPDFAKFSEQQIFHQCIPI